MGEYYDAFGRRLNIGDPVIAVRSNRGVGKVGIARAYVVDFGKGRNVKLDSELNEHLGWFSLDKVAKADWACDD